MSLTQQYRTLCLPEQWRGSLLRQVCLGEDGLRLEGGALWGAAALPPVDAGESDFSWDRLKLAARIPGEAGVRVYARASDQPHWPQWAGLAGAEDPAAWVRERFGPPLSAGTDLLLPCRGRYLWLALELTTGGGESPVVTGLSLRQGGDHMVDYLPAIYQEEDFTYRYLSIFNSLFQDMETAIDDLPRQLSPQSASEDMVRYLAGWLCLGPEDGTRDLRGRLAGILEEYERMYTPEGICRSVERLTGHRPRLIEHFSVDPNAPDCRNPELYRRLYGQQPYRMFVLLPQDTFSTQQEMEHFLRSMEELIPAETELELVLLKPCVQLDWHTYLGINSRIEGYVPAVIDESMAIHYNTTIGGTDHE